MAYTFKHGDRLLEGYTVQRAVGRGGFGEVYYAISDGGREVALKYLRDNPQVELRGVSHCINLKSPHLVSIFDVKKTNEDDYCIIMEYCSGPSLRDLLIAEPNGFAPEKAAFFLREIGKGLSYLHDRGIVHRDLKPGNIFYDDGYVKIGDYGLAKIITVSRHSAQTASVGTVHYMAPEIGSGNYSRGVDIYALGVMLYEMLMGTVPFEGSTMAEVLMKHLTSQPEVDKLPQPFGKVIRKALEKDPKDRYQTVDEMVEELLGAAEIERSLAGFSPKSLQRAVRQGGTPEHVSPMPSPNPPPRPPQGNLPPFAVPLGSRPAMTGKARKRLDRIARKVERKRAKLAGTRPRTMPPPVPQHGTDEPADGDLPERSIRRRRVVLTVFLTAALSVGLGVIVAQAANDEAIGAAAGMLIPALAGGIALGRKATRWFAIDYGPGWASGLVRGGCSLPLLAIACAPLFDVHEQDGVSVWLAMIAVAMFMNWDKSIDESRDGELSLGRAFGAALGGFIIYAISGAIVANGPDEDYMLLAAGVAGITSLILQASSLWLAPIRLRAGARARGGDDQHRGPGGSGHAQAAPPLAGGGAPQLAHEAGGTGAYDQYAAPDGIEGTMPLKPRWGITRAFWGFIALGAVFGTIATFVLSLVAFDSYSAYHDRTAAIIGCTSLFALAIFALRKTTALKRDGFWRETVRPFLQFVWMGTIGASITAISREWGHLDPCCGGQCVDDTGAGFLIAGLVTSSVMLIVITLFTSGRPRRRGHSFLTGCAPNECAPEPGTGRNARIVAVGGINDVDPLASTEYQA